MGVCATPEIVREPMVASAAVCESVCDASDCQRVSLHAVCVHMCVYVMAATVRSLWYHLQLSISVCDACAIREFVVASAVVCATCGHQRVCGSVCRSVRDPVVVSAGE